MIFINLPKGLNISIEFLKQKTKCFSDFSIFNKFYFLIGIKKGFFKIS